MKTNQIIITLVLAIIVGIAAFFGGMQYEKSKASNTTGNYVMMRNGAGARFGNRFGNGNQGGLGQVISQDANSITIKLADGTSKIILLSSNTKYEKTDTAAVSDIKNGDRVLVIGTANADGSETANTIQINPTFREAVTPTPAQ